VVSALEIVGELPGPWLSELDAYRQAAREEAWGGEGPDRLVLARIEPGGFLNAVRPYMPPNDFVSWLDTLGPEPRMLAKTFVARDDLITTVMIPVPLREAFLYGVSHQLLEAATLRRQAADGYTVPRDPELQNAHVLWRHYVVERVRRGLHDKVGLDLGEFDNTELVSEAKDTEAALTRAAADRLGPALPPEALWPWIAMLRVWCAARGCADAGAVLYAAELERFASQPYIAATTDTWARAAATLHEIWSEPEQSTARADACARDGMWAPMVSALRELWATLREAA